jgi:hypothetical protein
MDMTSSISSAQTGPAHVTAHTASKAAIPTRVNNFISHSSQKSFDLAQTAGSGTNTAFAKAAKPPSLLYSV